MRKSLLTFFFILSSFLLLSNFRANGDNIIPTPGRTDIAPTSKPDIGEDFLAARTIELQSFFSIGNKWEPHKLIDLRMQLLDIEEQIKSKTDRILHLHSLIESDQSDEDNANNSVSREIASIEKDTAKDELDKSQKLLVDLTAKKEETQPLVEQEEDSFKGEKHEVYKALKDKDWPTAEATITQLISDDPNSIDLQRDLAFVIQNIPGRRS